ncbi:hypothetical protein DFH29DRAFT_991633 [Suillus ampliporus]|nr:hypothetical protein DFH29DRAFT_991633 [Suillus ampliporus]
MTNYPGLRYFSKGISLVSQWTGTEHREMQRVFLGVLAGTVQPTVFRAARAVLDFIYYAQYHAHTSQTLDALKNALDEFHTHKHIFTDLGVRDDFNIPKLHSMMHYVDSIKSRGSADGFNTEFPERLHIDFTKNAYPQMTKWLMRQEMVDQFTAYLDWRLQRFGEDLEPATGGDEDDDDNDKEMPTTAPMNGDEGSSTQPIPVSTHILPSRPSFKALTCHYYHAHVRRYEFFARIDSVSSPQRSTCELDLLSANGIGFMLIGSLSIPYEKLPAIHMTNGLDRIRATPPTAPAGHVRLVPLANLILYLCELQEMLTCTPKGLH